jgi:hypothetical protein
MSVIKQSISLEEQPTRVSYKENPSTRYLNTIDYEVDASEYEEYSFTGNKSEIDSRFSSELSAGGTGWQVQATKTRLTGNLWELKIRKNKVRKKEEEDVTPEEQEAQENKWGSELAPRQTSVSITAIQQSILLHDKFKELSEDQLGAIKMYMNGAGAGENVTTEKGVFMLNEIYPYKSSLVKFAIKNPTYYVPSMSVTYSYWSASKKTSLDKIATIKSPPGVTVPQGYTSLFMGQSSSPLEKGYRVEETYLIGKINKEVYEDSSK